MEYRLVPLLSQVRYPGLDFAASREGAYWQLRVVAPKGSPLATCTVTGEDHSWNGRWWRLSEHMTDGEIIQTAFKAVLTALEHEARERFTFKGVSVFDPHYDIHKLVELRSQVDALKERD